VLGFNFPFWPLCTPAGLSLFEPCRTNVSHCDNFVGATLRTTCIGVKGRGNATVVATIHTAWLHMIFLAIGLLLILFASKVAESDLFYDTIGGIFGLLCGEFRNFFGMQYMHTLKCMTRNPFPPL
jgi:hypothetical protein